ncbi:MAG: hypothetical protein RIU67_730, partial [Actinomycetota bacterium]
MEEVRGSIPLSSTSRFVDPREFARLLTQVEFVASVPLSGLTQSTTQIHIAEKSQHVLGGLLDRAFLGEQPGDSVANRLGNAAGARSHNGNTARLRFDERKSEALPLTIGRHRARSEENGRTFQLCANPIGGNGAGPTNVHSQIASQGFHLWPQRAV